MDTKELIAQKNRLEETLANTITIVVQTFEKDVGIKVDSIYITYDPERDRSGFPIVTLCEADLGEILR